MGTKKQMVIHGATSVLHVIAAVFALFLAFHTSGFDVWFCSWMSIYCFGKLLLDTEPVDMKRWNTHHLKRREQDVRAREDKV